MWRATRLRGSRRLLFLWLGGCLILRVRFMPLLLGFFRCLLSLLFDLLVLIFVELETFHEHRLVLEVLLAESVWVS